MAHKQGYGTNLSRYLNLRLEVAINGGRKVSGVLRGFDQLMNIVLESAGEVGTAGKRELGTVLIRGNSILMWECLDRIPVT
jgi:small nuclear ribonucleoprotein G